jgi:glycine dehydrogenase subunit 1
MPFIPHTADDVARMLEVIGANSIDDLFDEIPAALKTAGLKGVPPALTEMQVGRLLSERALLDGRPLNFIGAGAYEHHIPAPVWAIATRGEFYSAYTPYQAEASQGTLQLIYEYQSMICALTGMEVSNASLYDGASGLAEACLMAVRANRASNSRRILLPRDVNPTYGQVARAITGNQNIEFEMVDFDRRTGRLARNALEAYSGQDFTALVLQQPNFFGNLEEVDELTDWAHANNVLVIAVVNPTSLALLKPPGEWGGRLDGKPGADIVCGEGQPLGVPLASGGPYFGFMATRTCGKCRAASWAERRTLKAGRVSA